MCSKLLHNFTLSPVGFRIRHDEDAHPRMIEGLREKLEWIRTKAIAGEKQGVSEILVLGE